MALRMFCCCGSKETFLGSNGFWLMPNWSRIMIVYGLLVGRKTVVGEVIDDSGLAHALVLVIDDDFIEVLAVEAQLYFTVSQIPGCFVAGVVEGESVVVTHMALGFDKEQFIVGLVGGEVSDAVSVHTETVNGSHFQNRMFFGIVLGLDPLVKLPVELVQRRQIEVA